MARYVAHPHLHSPTALLNDVLDRRDCTQRRGFNGPPQGGPPQGGPPGGAFDSEVRRAEELTTMLTLTLNTDLF